MCISGTKKMSNNEEKKNNSINFVNMNGIMIDDKLIEGLVEFGKSNRKKWDAERDAMRTDDEVFDDLIKREDFSWYDDFNYSQIICDIENYYIEELKIVDGGCGACETREEFEYRFNDPCSYVEYQNFMNSRPNYASNGQHINNNTLTIKDINAVLKFSHNYSSWADDVGIDDMLNFVIYKIADEIWDMIEPHKKVITMRP